MDFTVVNLEPHQAIAIRDNCTAAELSKKYTEIYGELGEIMKRQNLQFADHPFGMYHSFSPEAVDMEGGVVVKGDPKPEGRMHVIKTYEGKALRADFIGPYDRLHEGWNAAMLYAKDNNFEVYGTPFEVYVSDPSNEPDSSKLHTEIYLPIK